MRADCAGAPVSVVAAPKVPQVPLESVALWRVRTELTTPTPVSPVKSVREMLNAPEAL